MLRRAHGYWLNKGNIFYATLLVWAFAGIAFNCFDLGERLAMYGALMAIIIVLDAYVVIRNSK